MTIDNKSNDWAASIARAVQGGPKTKREQIERHAVDAYAPLIDRLKMMAANSSGREHGFYVTYAEIHTDVNLMELEISVSAHRKVHFSDGSIHQGNTAIRFFAGEEKLRITDNQEILKILGRPDGIFDHSESEHIADAVQSYFAKYMGA